MLIAEGTTLRVGPGATLQFWGTQPDDVYATFENTYLQVEGRLEVYGTANKPAVLKPSDLFSNRGVVIDNRGSVDISYANLWNLVKQTFEVAGYQNRSFERIDHSLISRFSLSSCLPFHRRSDGDFLCVEQPTFNAKEISHSRLYRLGGRSLRSRD